MGPSFFNSSYSWLVVDSCSVTFISLITFDRLWKLVRLLRPHRRPHLVDFPFSGLSRGYRGTWPPAQQPLPRQGQTAQGHSRWVRP